MTKYTITNQSLSAVIDLNGAELQQLSKNGIAYLHDGNPMFWSRTAPYLFPNVGALKDKQTHFFGKPYSLPKHGFIRDQLFYIQNHHQDRLTLTFKSNKITRTLYPFDFEIIIDYQVTSDALLCDILIKNDSISDMPFNFGLHPAFKIPLFSNEKFEDYTIHFSDLETCHVPSVDLATGLIDENKIVRSFTNLKQLPLNYDDYQNDAIIINPLKSNKVILKSENSTNGIEFSFNLFKTLGIWTPNHVNANFIAIEPWIGYADSPNSDKTFKTKKDLIWLKPNQVMTLSYQMRPL